jgi:uncharacterized protein
MTPFLDVNVLLALFDPAHPNHEDAHRWFPGSRRSGWASCAVTLNGCVRVLSNPAYPTVDATPAQVISRLRTLCADPLHAFWADDISRSTARPSIRISSLAIKRSQTFICWLSPGGTGDA